MSGVMLILSDVKSYFGLRLRHVCPSSIQRRITASEVSHAISHPFSKKELTIIIFSLCTLAISCPTYAGIGVKRVIIPKPSKALRGRNGHEVSLLQLPVRRVLTSSLVTNTE